MPSLFTSLIVNVLIPDSAKGNGPLSVKVPSPFPINISSCAGVVPVAVPVEELGTIAMSSLLSPLKSATAKMGEAGTGGLVEEANGNAMGR